MATAPCDVSERLLWTLQLSWNWTLTVNLSEKSLVCFSAFALSLWAGCNDNNNNSLCKPGFVNTSFEMKLPSVSGSIISEFIMTHVLQSSFVLWLFFVVFFTGKVLLNTVRPLQMTFCMYSSSIEVTDDVLNWSLCCSCLPFKGTCLVPHMTNSGNIPLSQVFWCEILN